MSFPAGIGVGQTLRQDSPTLRFWPARCFDFSEAKLPFTAWPLHFTSTFLATRLPHFPAKTRGWRFGTVLAFVMYRVPDVAKQRHVKSGAAKREIMSKTAQVILTIGEIARQLGAPIHSIDYVIRARRILPSGWAGNARVFSPEDVIRIESELSRIRQSRPTGLR